MLKSLYGNKAHFTSYYCEKNLINNEVITEINLKVRFEPTLSINKADFFVVKTCGFLGSRRNKS